MRKKPVKSTSVGSDLKRRIVKKQQGGVASYINVNEPVLQYNNDWIELPDAFSEYNLPTKIKPHNEEPLPIAIKAVDTKEERAKADSERKPVKQNAFINGLRPIIEQTLKRRGLDTKWTDHLVAQAALESGWGKSESGKFNLSGIKGKGSEKNTKEYINGKMVNTRDSFRDYKDYNDWADNYINLLSNKRYGKAWTLSEDQFMPYIINAGYATDPNYISKYNKVLAEVKKYENGGRIRRFQNAGIIARDNTRMPTVIAPKLKEQPQIPIPNQTYLSQAPSKEIREANNFNKKMTDVQNFGESLKQQGMNLRDGAAVMMSMLVPPAGMVLGLGDASINAAQGNYTEGAIQAGLEMLPYGLNKVSKSISKIAPKVKRFANKSNNFVPDKSINLDNVTREYNRYMNDFGEFYNYLSDPTTLARLKSIDDELGTNYYNTIINYINKAKENPIKQVFGTKSGLLSKGEYGASVPSKFAIKDPLNPEHYKMEISPTSPPSTTGHEIKHLLEYMQAFSSMPETEKSRILQLGSLDEIGEAASKFMNNTPRLQKLVENNIVDFETFKVNYRAMYPNTKLMEKDLLKMYKYHTKPTEVNSQLHPIILERIKQSKSGIPNYQSVNELDMDITKAIASENNNSLNILYNAMIKDKKKFMQTLNKYGYVGIPAIIGGINIFN